MGPWEHIYKKGSRADPGTPYGYGIHAVKMELVYQGFEITHFDPTIGVAADRAIRAFQDREGIRADGEVGPLTAKHLFAKRCNDAESAYGIPNDFVTKIVELESAFDPGAVGVADPSDHGIVQINALAHPEITLPEAFNPDFAIGYLGRVLRSAHNKLGDWECAVAAWNVGGGGASDWCGMNKPYTGGPPWAPTLYERATRYVSLVEGEKP